jgi:hypothetical protein
MFTSLKKWLEKKRTTDQIFACLGQLVFVFTLSLAQVNCINLKLGDATPQRAADIEFIEPKGPYVLFKDTEADKSWQSNQTGNVIAMFSDCSKGSDKALTLALKEISKGFDRLEENSSKTFFYNGREALYGHFRGHIDGIKVSMESLVFNKNKCFYQLSFSGVTTQYDREKEFFEKFVKEFRAP